MKGVHEGYIRLFIMFEISILVLVLILAWFQILASADIYRQYHIGFELPVRC